MRIPGAAVVVVLGCALLGCAACATQERIDPHNPGDRCLYSCPNGLRCAGTVFRRGTTPLYGRCELEPHRCLTIADCLGGETCARFGSEIGLCRPVPLTQ